MTRVWLSAVVLVGGLGRAQASEVHNPLADPDAPHSVYVVTAIDPTFANGVGYSYAVPVTALSRVVTLSADLTMPWFAFDGHHYRLDAGGAVALVDHRALHVFGELHAQLSGGKNWVHTATAVGVEGVLVAGYFVPRWFAGVEASIAYTPLTYLVHSDTFRDSQYADVVDGWYAGTDGRLAVAVEAGRCVAPRWQVGVRVGRYTTLALSPPQALAYVADLAVTRRF